MALVSFSSVGELLEHFVDPLEPLGIIYRDGSLQFWPLVILVTVGLLGYWASLDERDRFSLANAARFIFPAKTYSHRSAWMDYQGFILTALFHPAIKLATISIGVDAVRTFLTSYFGETATVLPQGWITVALQVLVFVVAIDFAGFLAHYSEHKVPFLWSFHRVHHSAEVMNPLTTYRKHPIELIYFGMVAGTVSGSIMGLFLYLTGTQLTAGTLALMGVYYVVLIGANYLYHSQMWVSFGKFEKLILSPAMHQIHHSVFLHHRDKNLGSILSIWDRLFGTFYATPEPEHVVLGISEEEIGLNNPHRTIAGYYVEPLLTSVKSLLPERREQEAPAAKSGATADRITSR